MSKKTAPIEYDSRFDAMISKRVYLARFSGEEAKDLAQEMRLAIWSSCKTYDPQKGKKLDNYLHRKIDWVIKRYQKRMYKDIPRDADGKLLPLANLDKDYEDSPCKDRLEYEKFNAEGHIDSLRDIEVQDCFREFLAALSPLDREIINLLMTDSGVSTHSDIAGALNEKAKELGISGIARSTVTKRINKLKTELTANLYN